MPCRTALVVLTIALCATLALGYVNDVGVSMIIAPTDLSYTCCDTIWPAAEVTNYGSAQTNVPVHCRIREKTSRTVVYDQVVNISLLMPGQAVKVYLSFYAYQCVEAVYVDTMLTELVGDQNQTNDWKANEFAVSFSPPGWTELELAPEAVGTGGWLAHKPGDRYVYVCCGGNTSAAGFYRYDIMGKSWLERKSVSAYDGARGVHDGGNFIYATIGEGHSVVLRYDIIGGNWVGLPLVGRHGENGSFVPASLYGGTDLAYVPGQQADFVYLTQGMKGSFYSYVVSGHAWIYLGKAPPDAGNSLWRAGSFITYDGDHTIYAFRSYANEIWAYDFPSGPPWGAWSRRWPPTMPGSQSEEGGCGDWYDGDIYALKGAKTDEFWRWDAGNPFWDDLEPIPGPSRVDSGADIVSRGGCGTFYALKGGKTSEFWQYVLPLNQSGGVQSGAIGADGDAGMHLTLTPSLLTGNVVYIGYTLNQAGPGSITFFDISGRAAIRCAFIGERAGQLSLDLHFSPAGVYLVRLDDGQRSVVRKLVVQR